MHTPQFAGSHIAAPNTRARKSRDGIRTMTPPGLIEESPTTGEGWQGLDQTRRWVFATGAACALAVILAAFVILNPLTAAHDDLRQVTDNGIPVQLQLADMRTTVFNWQIFIETHLDKLAPGKAPSPTGSPAVRNWYKPRRRKKRPSPRGSVASDSRTTRQHARHRDEELNAAIVKLTPIAAGEIVTAAQRTTIVTAERTALRTSGRPRRHWVNPCRRTSRPPRTTSGAPSAHGPHDLPGRPACDLALVIGVALIFGLRAEDAANAPAGARRNG